MTLNDRLLLTARIAACSLAGSVAGFLAWAIGALGIGSLVWVAPFMLVVALFFGLPSFGLLLAIGLLFARSIHRHTGIWCVALPLVSVAGWHAYDANIGFPADGAALIALCAAISSALFFAWDRYLAVPRAGTTAAA